VSFPRNFLLGSALDSGDSAVDTDMEWSRHSHYNKEQELLKCSSTTGEVMFYKVYDDRYSGLMGPSVVVNQDYRWL